MRFVLILFVAGGCGTLCRYGLAALVHQLAGEAFPWRTAAVNLAGCFLFGLVYALAEGRVALGATAKAAILTGFMGAFTTFSTYLFDTHLLLRDGRHVLAALNVGGQTALGLLALAGGMALGR